MTTLLQLTLFGSPEVQRHGQSVTGFRSSKAQALLYYLAVTGRSHTRPTLAGLFWGDQPEAGARTSLSKCLSNLRKLVGDVVLVERQSVTFNCQFHYQLDVERFSESFYVLEAPDFEQWVLVQRAHYREADRLPPMIK